jgi:hypothetical protein
VVVRPPNGAKVMGGGEWFSSMATFYKNNPYVWLRTNNEPSFT